MSELNVTSSQSGAREELQQDDIWGETEEDIWAEIFHENGETLLRNIPSGDSPTNEAKLETIDFEDMYLEDKKDSRPKHQQIVFIQPKKENVMSVKTVEEGSEQTIEQKSSASPESCESSWDSDEDIDITFDVTRFQHFFKHLSSEHKLNRKDENPNLLQPNSMEDTIKKPRSEKATATKQTSKILRNWLTSHFIERFSTSSIKPFKPDKQGSSPQAHVAQPPTLAKRIRNAIRPKAPTVSPGFIEVTEPRIQEFDNIARPLRSQQDTWQQPDRRGVCKRFGANAEKYVICDEWTKDGEKDSENVWVDRGVAAESKRIEETGASKWSKLKFWTTGLFSTQENALPPESSRASTLNNKSNKNLAKVSDYYQMVEQRGGQ